MERKRREDGSRGLGVSLAGLKCGGIWLGGNWLQQNVPGKARFRDLWT